VRFLITQVIKLYSFHIAYPSSHPVIKNVETPEEIDQLFDVVETSKGAAVFRMMEYEIGEYDLLLGIIVKTHRML
jgi:aminopeptidase N